MIILLSLLSLLSLLQSVAAQFDVIQSQRNATNSTWSLTWAARPNSNNSVNVYPLRGQQGFLNNAPRLPVSVLTAVGPLSNTDVINDSTIAFISCDLTDYPRPDSIGPAMVYAMAVQRNAAAILLYSRTNTSCDLIGPRIPDYDRSWTLIASTDAERIQSDEVSSPSPIIATIGLEPFTIDYGAYPSLTNPGQVNTQQSGPPQRPQSMNTQVAMIILYTVTGVVTALFLVIITTGAIRAHRHPERYGPRNIIGRPRQTRARGLARAMLDSLPIVKFNDPDSPKPDTNRATRDAELAENPTTLRSDSEPTLKDGRTPNPDPTSPNQADTASVRSGIGPAVEPAPNDSNALGIAAPHPGCSICTEDFEDGQDLRVLPCDHRFHAACVDPWLLNVSGTCPLCRIDLRKGSTDADAPEGQGEGDLPPPLEMGTAGQTGQAGQGQGRELERSYRTSVRRSLLFPVFGVSEGERDEIMEMLRRWRERGGTAATGEEGERRTRRLSRVFGIRTRREGRGSVSAANGQGQAVSREGTVDGARAGSSAGQGRVSGERIETVGRGSGETGTRRSGEGGATASEGVVAVPEQSAGTQAGTSGGTVAVPEQSTSTTQAETSANTVTGPEQSTSTAQAGASSDTAAKEATQKAEEETAAKQ
ncbi:Ring finger domain-containing protein 3 [Elsinoe fawcettii]|nr:Ring finger domain-containing protein 3 [Elsinoe fawcettii]